MTSKRDLESEIDSLKKDIEVLRKKAAEEGNPHLASSISSEFHNIRSAIEETLNTADSEISEHPIIAIVAAVALGFVIGRIAAI